MVIERLRDSRAWIGDERVAVRPAPPFLPGTDMAHLSSVHSCWGDSPRGGAPGSTPGRGSEGAGLWCG